MVANHVANKTSKMVIKSNRIQKLVQKILVKAVVSSVAIDSWNSTLRKPKATTFILKPISLRFHEQTPHKTKIAYLIDNSIAISFLTNFIILRVCSLPDLFGANFRQR